MLRSGRRRGPVGHNGSMSDAAQREAGELDDVVDRVELRDRFAMLLQELRVVLPGTQVLLAFLLTAPFSQRFGELDRLGRVAYATALLCTAGAVITLLGPVMLHRFGERTARAQRLHVGIALTTLGVVLVAVGLLAALWAVGRLVFGGAFATGAAGALCVALAVIWWVLPRRLRSSAHSDAPEPERR